MNGKMAHSAILPEGMASVDHSIASMDVGDQGWTFPWAMYHDKSRRLWLNGGYPLHSNPFGTAEMLVSRKDDGWHVDASRCANHRWLDGGHSGEFPPILVVSFST